MRGVCRVSAGQSQMEIQSAFESSSWLFLSRESPALIPDWTNRLYRGYNVCLILQHLAHHTIQYQIV